MSIDLEITKKLLQRIVDIDASAGIKTSQYVWDGAGRPPYPKVIIDDEVMEDQQVASHRYNWPITIKRAFIAGPIGTGYRKENEDALRVLKVQSKALYRNYPRLQDPVTKQAFPYLHSIAWGAITNGIIEYQNEEAFWGATQIINIVLLV